jgi:phosphoglycolate phosphatase-like HAD superfamily hydrolase
MTACGAAVIFDVDGTLVDSNDAHARAWVQAFAERGIPVAYEAVRRAIGMGGDKLMPNVAGIEEDSPKGKAIAGRRAGIFKTAYLPHLRAFPRTRELVLRLKQDRYTLTVASSAKEDELRPLLEIARVADLIPIRASSDDAEKSKPDPDILAAALKRNGCPARAAIMIGDTPYDVEASRRAGIRVVALECGGWSRADLAGAISIYHDPADLLAHYDQSVLDHERIQGLR